MKLNIGSRFRLDQELLADVVAIVGRRGRGKTTTAVVLVEELARAGARFCVADPVGVWSGLKSSKDGKSAGLPVIVMGGDRGDVPLEETAGKVIADFIADPASPSVILDFLHFRKGQMSRFMTDFLEELYHRNRAALHLVLDEADKFAPQRVTGDVARLVGAAEDVVKMGRARGILPMLITQRPASLNKNVLSQAGLLVAHALTGPQDRKALDEWIRENAEESERTRFHETIAGLPRGTAWFWQPEAELFELVEVRDRKTFDSSATPKAGARPSSPKVVAEVDLEALKTRIADTIERAKATDPKELQKRVRQLERELAAKPKLDEPKVERVEVPVLGKDELARLEVSVSTLGKYSEGLHERTRGLTEILADVAQALAKVGRNGHTPTPRPTKAAAPIQPSREREAARRARPSRESSAAELGKGERIILAAVAQHAEGVTRQQLTVLTGYKRSSRDTYLQRLRTAGLVEDLGGQITATEEGVDALGPDFEPLPTGDDLRRYWLERLPAGERTILEPLIEAFPNAVRRDELDVPYQRSSRDTYLQRLSARQLVDTPGPGLVRASEELFS